MDELNAIKQSLTDINEQMSKGFISKDDYESKMTELNDKIAGIEAKQAEVDEEMRKRATVMNGLEDEKKQFSMLNVIKGATMHDWGDEYELNVMKEYKKKVLSTTGGSGGYLVPPQAIQDVIELLHANVVVESMGATVMTDLMGSPVTLPRQSGGATGYWVAENAAITASGITDEQLSMTPHKACALVKISNELIRLSNPGAEALVRSDIARTIAKLVDLAALRGTGASNQPTGVINTSGIGDVNLGANGARANFTNMESLVGAVEDANVMLNNTAGFIMHPKAKRLLKTERIAQYSAQTDGQYVILPMSDQNLEDSLGYKFATTTQIPTNLTKGSGTNLTEIYFGVWSELLMAMWGGMEIASSNVAGDNNGGAFTSDQTWVRVIQLVDIALRHAASFSATNEAYSVAS